MFMESTRPPSSHSSGCVCPTRGGCRKGGSSCRPCNLVQTVCLSVRLSVCLSVCLSCPAHGEQVPPAVSAAPPSPPSPLPPRPPRSTRTNSERQLRQTRVTAAAMSLARKTRCVRGLTNPIGRFCAQLSGHNHKRQMGNGMAGGIRERQMPIWHRVQTLEVRVRDGHEFASTRSSRPFELASLFLEMGLEDVRIDFPIVGVRKYVPTGTSSEE